MARTPPDPIQQAIARGVSAFEREDYRSALQAFQEVLATGRAFADVRNKAGLCHAMLGETEAALRQFEAALEQNDAYAEAHVNRGLVLNELGRHEEAQKAFSRAQELDTRDGTVFPSELGNRLAVTHAKLGDLYLIAGRPALAAEAYAAGLEVRPRFLDIRSKLAEALLEMGEPEKALRELEAILESNPGFTSARIRLGVVLRRLGERERAIEEWRRCQREDPRDLRPRAYLVSVGADAEA
ncbi:MAG: tetratricopeptide repeat protein [Gemmatimonadetes bacterium]|nr:tetratricopeptide repeat protein [Gemmatimonadota bacterium]